MGIRLFVKFLVGRGYGVRDAAEHFRGCFQQFSCFIAFKISSFQNGNGILGQLRDDGREIFLFHKDEFLINKKRLAQ